MSLKTDRSSTEKHGEMRVGALLGGYLWAGTRKASDARILCMQNPLLVFHDWYVVQPPLVRTHVASLIFQGLPDSAIGARQLIERGIDSILKDWLNEHAAGQACRVVGTAVAVRAVIEFFLMSTRASPARSVSVEAITDATLKVAVLRRDPVWCDARASWNALCCEALSDSSLDAWVAGVQWIEK
jgi:hypothetical protein